MTLWTVDQAAEALHLARRTVYEWARAGRLPCVRLGRRVLFDPEELKKWIELHREGRVETCPGGAPRA